MTTIKEVVRNIRCFTYFISALLLASVGTVKGCVGYIDGDFREKNLYSNIAAGNYQTAHEFIEKEQQKKGLSELEYVLNLRLENKMKQEDAENYVRFHYQDKRADDFDIFTIWNKTEQFPFTTPLEKVVQDTQEYYAIANKDVIYLSNGSTAVTATESNGINLNKFLAQNQFQFPALGTSPSVPAPQKEIFVDINSDGYDEEILWKPNGWVYVFDGYTNARLQVIYVGKPQVTNIIRFDELNGKRYLAIATDTAVYAIADGWLK